MSSMPCHVPLAFNPPCRPVALWKTAPFSLRSSSSHRKVLNPHMDQARSDSWCLQLQFSTNNVSNWWRNNLASLSLGWNNSEVNSTPTHRDSPVQLSPNCSQWQLLMNTPWTGFLSLLSLTLSHFYLRFLRSLLKLLALKTWSQGLLLGIPNLTHTLRPRKESLLSWASCFLEPYSESPVIVSLHMQGGHGPTGTGLCWAQPHPCSKFMGCHNSQSKVLWSHFQCLHRTLPYVSPPVGRLLELKNSKLE